MQHLKSDEDEQRLQLLGSKTYVPLDSLRSCLALLPTIALRVEPSPPTIVENSIDFPVGKCLNVWNEKEQQKLAKLVQKKKDYETHLEEARLAWKSTSKPTGSDPFKTLFVGRLAYAVTEKDLERELQRYGKIKSVTIVREKSNRPSSRENEELETKIESKATTEGESKDPSVLEGPSSSMESENQPCKPRGYAFVEFEREKDMKAAYWDADGMKIAGRRVVLDIERGRETVKGWYPRRLGGGLGTTRRGGRNENQRESGRDPILRSVSAGPMGGMPFRKRSPSPPPMRQMNRRGPYLDRRDEPVKYSRYEPPPPPFSGLYDRRPSHHGHEDRREGMYSKRDSRDYYDREDTRRRLDNPRDHKRTQDLHASHDGHRGPSYRHEDDYFRSSRRYEDEHMHRHNDRHHHGHDRHPSDDPHGYHDGHRRSRPLNEPDVRTSQHHPHHHHHHSEPYQQPPSRSSQAPLPPPRVHYDDIDYKE